MSEFKDFTTTPTLTLDPFAEQEMLPEVIEEAEAVPAEPGWDDSILNDEERQMVEAFSNQIDLKNSNMIMQYGAGAQKKMADFSETALDNVKTQDLGEVGERYIQRQFDKKFPTLEYLKKVLNPEF